MVGFETVVVRCEEAAAVASGAETDDEDAGTSARVLALTASAGDSSGDDAACTDGVTAGEDPVAVECSDAPVDAVRPTSSQPPAARSSTAVPAIASVAPQRLVEGGLADELVKSGRSGTTASALGCESVTR
jgi:hypothetical protein